jgi:hypothetical protein
MLRTPRKLYLSPLQKNTTTLYHRKGHTVPQWALKLNGAPVAGETWHLKGYMLNINTNYTHTHQIYKSSADKLQVF